MAPSVPHASFELLILDGPRGGEAVEIPSHGRVGIGAGPDCEIQLQHPSMVARHAELAIAPDGTPWIRDLSGGRTLVNGSSIASPTPLDDGAFLQLGALEVCLRRSGAGGSGTHVPQRSRPKTSAPRSPTNPGRAPSGVVARPSPTMPPRRPPTVPPAAAPMDEEMGGATRVRRSNPSVEDGGDSLRDGEVINGRYRVIAKLAEGGMGEVYKVEHVELGKPFAMKVMKSQLGNEADFAERFKREAVAASQIGHPNIVDVSDFGRTERGNFFFVMEFLSGTTLGGLIRDHGSVHVNRALVIMVQLCRALAAAHKFGIVHRDLKPENVMLLQRPGSEDFLKILDFGVAKVSTNTDDGKGTAAGVVVGTPQYMAPEQAAGLPTDVRTDIYATGLIFYELLKGKPPFEETTPSLLMAAHIYKQPAALTFSTGDPVPEPIQGLVMRMLAKEREKRPQSMDEVLAELNRALAERRDSVARMATPAASQAIRAMMGPPPPGMQAPAPSPSGSQPPYGPPPSGAQPPYGPPGAQAYGPPGSGPQPAYGPPGSGAYGPPGSGAQQAYGPPGSGAQQAYGPPGSGAQQAWGIPPGSQPGWPAPQGGWGPQSGPQQAVPPQSGVQAWGPQSGVMALPPRSKGPLFAVVGVVALGIAGAVVFWPKPPAPTPVPVPAPVVVEKPVPTPPTPVAPAPKMVKVSLTSTPPGARVMRGDAVVGTTPFELEWEKGQALELELTLAGYNAEAVKLEPMFDLKLDVPLKAVRKGPANPPSGTRPDTKPDTKPPPKDLLTDPYGEQVDDLKTEF